MMQIKKLAVLLLVALTLLLVADCSDTASSTPKSSGGGKWQKKEAPVTAQGDVKMQGSKN